MLFTANIAVEQEVIAADKTIALLILSLRASDVHQKARSIKAKERLCSEALTLDEVGLLQNFRAYQKWILFSSNF